MLLMLYNDFVEHFHLILILNFRLVNDLKSLRVKWSKNFMTIFITNEIKNFRIPTLWSFKVLYTVMHIGMKCRVESSANEMQTLSIWNWFPPEITSIPWFLFYETILSYQYGHYWILVTLGFNALVLFLLKLYPLMSVMAWL